MIWIVFICDNLSTAFTLRIDSDTALPEYNIFIEHEIIAEQIVASLSSAFETCAEGGLVIRQKIFLCMPVNRRAIKCENYWWEATEKRNIR